MPERGGPTPEDLEVGSAPQEVTLSDGLILRVGETYELPSVSGGEPSTVRIREFDSRGGSVMFELLDAAGNAHGSEGGSIERFSGARLLENGTGAEAAPEAAIERSGSGIGTERDLKSSDVAKYHAGTWYEDSNVTGLIRRINASESTITVVEVPRTVMVYSNTMGRAVQWEVKGFAKEAGYDVHVTRKPTPEEARKNPEGSIMGKDIRFSEIAA